MYRIRSVLVAVDYSDEARHALRLGMGVVARLGCGRHRLVALHVAAEPETAAAAERVEEKLRGFAASALYDLAHAVEPVARFGDPAAQTLTTAAQLGADLVVIGARGTGRAPRLGGVATAVLRHAWLPVLAVNGPPPGQRRVPADPTGYLPLLSIVAPTDLTAGSQVGERLALELATAAGAELHIVHVEGSHWFADPAGGRRGQARAAVADTIRLLREGTPIDRRRTRSIETHVRSGRSVAEAIDRCARDLRGTLIVMASRTGDGPSTTAQLVERGAAAVLRVPRPPEPIEPGEEHMRCA